MLFQKLLARFKWRAKTSSERIAIYTAILGNYDELREQPPCEDADFVCFTDSSSLTSKSWKIVFQPGHYPTPRLSAKWFKLHPHLVLNAYRWTIWIDAGISIRTTAFAQEMIGHLRDRGISLMRHPDRDNIFDEAKACLTLPKCKGLPLLQQVAHYRAQGFHSKNGLYAGTIIVRDNANPTVVRLNEDWMAENIEWTYQDQLSLPFLLEKHGVNPGILPYNLYDNEAFTWSNLTFSR